MSELAKDSQSLKGLPAPTVSVDDLYEVIYRLIGGLVLYVVLFHEGLDFKQKSILKLFSEQFPIETFFNFIVFVFILLSLSSLATYFFNFINILNYVLFHIANQFKKDSITNRFFEKLRETFFPTKVFRNDDQYDKNFTKGLYHLYSLSIKESVDKSVLATISSIDFFGIIAQHVKSTRKYSYNSRMDGLISLGKCLFAAVNILACRYLFIGDYSLFFVFVVFGLIIWNSVKNAVEASRHSLFVMFYSDQLFNKIDDSKNK
jgi:hypothetical protein